MTLNIRILALVCIAFLLVYALCVGHYTEMWGTFGDKTLQAEYRTQGIKYQPESGRLIKCHRRKKRTQCDTIVYKHPFSQTNHRQSAILCNDKASTSRLLMMNGIRCPRFARFDKLPTLNECTRILRAYGVRFPAVVKPIDGAQGNGVHLNVRDCKEVLNIMRKLYGEGRTRIIVEEQVTGENYRILVYNGKIFDVVHRELASVVGDGYHTVNQLIDQRNQRQRVQMLYPTRNVNWTYIHEQIPSMSVSRLPTFVVPRGKRLFITNIGKFRNGCNTHRIPLDRISKQTKEQFVKINKILGLQMSGIDYISKDISDPDNIGYVNEVNSGPDFKMHQAALPRDNKLTARFVQRLFQ